MPSQPEYICKNCAHIRLSFLDKALSLFGLLPVHPYNYMCARPIDKASFSGKELVVGVKQSKVTCISEREDYFGRPDVCGTEGKYWVPKKNNSENLIKYMKK